MSNLLVEIGNTALKAAWSDGLTLGKTFRYQGEKMFDFIESLVNKEKPSVMVVSSSIKIDRKEEERMMGNCGKLFILDRDHTGLLEEYGLPAYLSPDRAASVIASRHLFKGKGSLIFDFGTTLSIDMVDGEGQYLGGNISPGWSLPLVDTPSTVIETGNSLVSSIEAGVVGGIMFEIQGYLSRFPEKVAVFTGGDALYFAKRMKNSIFVVCNLVLMGLALIAESYAERKV